MLCVKSAKYAALLSFGITSCDVYQPHTSEDGHFFFSNDSSENYPFFIDNKLMVIPKTSVGSLYLKQGLHSMTTEEGQHIYFMVYPDNKGGILNPQKHLYYSYSFVYGNNGIPSVHNQTIQELTVGDYRIKGRVQSSDNIIIDNNVFNCDYSIGVQIPEQLNSLTTVSKIKTKCFSYSELITAISSDDKQMMQLVVRQNEPVQNNTVSLTFDYPVTLPVFEDQQIQQYAVKVNTLIQAYRGSADPEKKQDFYNQYHVAVSNMAGLYSQWETGGNCLEERQKYLQFLSQTAAILSAGVLKLDVAPK
ncbi:hypothetical protein LDO51_16135 [Providencia alcalifaciens]|uniref:hypothetical protein n=1 Tax=Providencia alcalifaciens TaxID=126385 RepID=UPI001CE0B320|nr:hypothetical protein [Providencia alcalifaciens]UBX48658.1 hypothetical protein LDO51_16135 [Providencia alcalifaciens]